MKTEADPTGQARNRRRAVKPFNARLAKAEKRVLAIVGDMRSSPRVTQVNTQKTLHDWSVTPEQLADIRAQVALEIQAELETMTARPPQQWYGGEVLTGPAQAGALDAVNTINRDLAALVAGGLLVRGLKPQLFDSFGMLSAPKFRDRLNRNILTLFASVKSTADRLASRVANDIIQATKARSSPRVLRREVKSSFERARSDIKRGTDTGVNEAFTDSVFAATDTAAETLDREPRVIHISALTSTTRSWHASRHRLTYTVEDQEAWWNESHNRTNCKCSVLPSIEPISTEKTEPTPVSKPKKVKPKIEREPKAVEVIDQIKKARPSKPVVSIPKSKKPVTVEPQKLTTKRSEVAPKTSKVGINSEQSAYLEYYKSDGFYESNKILRNPAAYESRKVDAAFKMRGSIDTAVGRHPFKSDGVLYRGLEDGDVFARAEKIIGKDIPILTPQSTATTAGGAIRWAGLVKDKSSDAFFSAKRQSVVMKINVKKGQHGLNMEKLGIGSTGESEVLLRSGGNYRVKAVRELKDDAGTVTGKVIEVDYIE